MTEVLHVGCGRSKEPGAFGIDIRPFPGVDLVHDLDRFPYPLESNRFDRVLAIDVLEHLEHFVGVVEELHRVAKPGAELVVTAPFATSLYRHHDPTHRRGLTRLSFDYFIPGTELAKYGYSEATFRRKLFGYSLNEERGIVGRLVRSLAIRKAAFYERHLRFVYPMDNVFFVLEVVK